MINSKNLKKLSDKLENIDLMLKHLNSEVGCHLRVEGSGETGTLYIGLSADEQTTCDLGKEIVKALRTYRSSVERQIQAIVRH